MNSMNSMPLGGGAFDGGAFEGGEPLGDLSANGPVRRYEWNREGATSTEQETAAGATAEVAAAANTAEQNEAEQNGGNESAKDGSAKRARAGRPPILDATKRAEICAMVAAGCTFKTAALYVGCSAAAISVLMSRDASFREQIGRAIAQRESIPLSHLREASKRSWRAAAWLLERTVKGTYCRDNSANPVDVALAVEIELREKVDVAISSAAELGC